MKTKYTTFTKIFLVATTLLTFGACNLLGGGDGAVGVSVTGNPQAVSRSAALGSVTTELNSNTISINTVEMVFFAIDLHADDAADGIEDLEAGPILMELPLDGSLKPLFPSITIPPGSYNQLGVEVKRPDGHELADDFTETYPDWDATKSIRITGTYNSAEFDLMIDFNDDFELKFDEPVIIGEDGLDLILAIYVNKWFLNGAGTDLIDPAVAKANLDGPEADQIIDNIIDSFEAYEDSLDED